jgi:hypothetical protein
MYTGYTKAHSFCGTKTILNYINSRYHNKIAMNLTAYTSTSNPGKSDRPRFHKHGTLKARLMQDRDA